MQCHLLAALAICLLVSLKPSEPPEGLHFTFKNRAIALTFPARQGSTDVYFPRSRYDVEKLDTLSNWYNPAVDYVEIIRQDDPLRPTVGMALGFEFDDDNGEYPYTPARAVLQIKNFGWGGVEFSARDTMNYTGVSNDVSEDLQIEIDGYQNDTIWGRFSGLLVSGAGSMASIEKGRFRVKLYRVE